ncbi:MAG: carbamoyltransferase family protein, partial [Gammaproteobacteria bacterium]
ECTERYLQNKRAINTPADDPIRIPKLIDAYCEPDAELVVARSWSRLAAGKMKTDAASMLKAVSGCDPGVHGEWIRRVMFHVGMWDQFVGPNYQLAGTGVAAYCARRNRKLIQRDYAHHLTHAAYACLTSGFDAAVCAVFDGYGEGESHDYFHYAQGALASLPRRRSSDNRYGSLSSLGMYYGYTICSLFGFTVINGEEWKVMGLAAYGSLDHELYALLQRHVYADGLDLVMNEQARDSFVALQCYAKRKEQSFEEVADIAYTAQYHFNEILISVLTTLYELGVSDNFVFSGGCALNSSFNGLIAGRTKFENIYIPPAPSDDGNAVGAALLAFGEDNPQARPPERFHSPYLGSAIDQRELDAFLNNGALLGRVDIEPDDVIDYVARELANGKIVGWMQGRAEFGPRALGNRSILADPRRPEMKQRINAVVKFRESFRPFAPAILHEYGSRYFEGYVETPYMERTLTIKPGVRSELAAVTHVDGTGRVQSVKREWNRRFYDLISAFHEVTDVPVLLNTSLNVMGKPIAHSAGDAFNLYLSSGMDILVIGEHVFRKAPSAARRARARSRGEGAQRPEAAAPRGERVL